MKLSMGLLKRLPRLRNLTMIEKTIDLRFEQNTAKGSIPDCPSCL